MMQSSKILIAILSLDLPQSKELLSWAISVVAHPNDHIVAIHFLPPHQFNSQIRLAKAHVISVLAEFATICQHKQINLEARVGSSSSVGKGLIEEAKSISADYLILSGINKSNRIWNETIRYCLKHAPGKCTVVSIGKHENSPQHSDSAIVNEPRNKIERNVSPKSVLEDECHSTEIEDESKSFQGSTTTEFSQNVESKSRKYLIPGYKFISSVFGSPLRKPKDSFSYKENKQRQRLISCFSYEEIANATNYFHSENMVGRGGYSEVYKGELRDGRRIAVKRLAKDNENVVKEKEFLIELGVIGHVSHPNTATLLGYCIQNGLYLIFSFSQNGTLSSALHGKTSKVLEWKERYKIALGVARGLHYLHQGCKRRIIHRDIKASNILLGPDYEPQITDFGLAKWLPNKWTHHAVIPIEGTFGYLAPEYFMHGIVDEKTDVFAFGILLLEIVTGRRPVDSSRQNLLLWAKPLMEAGKITELADPRLNGKYDEDQMYNVVLTASFCVRQSSIWRPSMVEVLELLLDRQDSETTRSWRMPKFTSDELDDYSMVFGYDVPVDIALEDYL